MATRKPKEPPPLPRGGKKVYRLPRRQTAVRSTLRKIQGSKKPKK